MSHKSFLICVFVVSVIVHETSAQWGYSQEEIDVFDLADEFKANFYEFMGLTQDVSSSDIRRSYRKMSLTMHPDKNKTEGAEENFRLLAAVYEVLKNKEKRQIYDNVLANGIPSAYLYVPKQMRKMSLTEVSVIISLVFTFGHYLFMWCVYAEKRLALEEILPRLRKKKLKAKKKGESQNTDDIDQIPSQFLQKPSIIDIFPIAFCRCLYRFIKFLPVFIRQKREEARRLKEEEQQRRLEEEEAARKYEEELIKREEKKILRKERIREKQEEMLKYVETSIDSSQYQTFDDPSNTLEEIDNLYDEWADDKSARKKKNSKKNGEWSSEDESELVKLMSKYPVGSSQRWQLIADELNKRVPEVISKAKQIKNTIGKTSTGSKQGLKPSKKENASKISNDITIRDSEYEREIDSNDSEKSENIANGKCEDDNEAWSQTQQKLLELALQQFPKGTPERWEKIAKCVPSKQKEDCLARYRYLAEKVQQKRRTKS